METIMQSIVPANLKFPTGSTKVGIVGNRNRGTKESRKFWSFTHHILGITYISIEATGESISEQSEIDTYVIALYGFPCQQGRDKTWCTGNICLLTILQPCTCYWVIGNSLIGLIPVVDILVTQRTVREAELQVVEPLDICILHETLFGDSPTEW